MGVGAHDQTSLKKYGEAIVELIISLQQEVATLKKDLKAQKKQMEELKERKESTIRALNAKLRASENELEFTRTGRRPVSPNDSAFKLGDSVRYKT